MTNLDISVCALVVTYNRKDLLLECLEALKKQSYPPKAILIVDNYSALDTLTLLHENGYIGYFSASFEGCGGNLVYSVSTKDNVLIDVHYLRLDFNSGGAGGFSAGMRYFYSNTKYDHLWLMDDDSKPSVSALHELVVSYQDLSSRQPKLGYLCSQVQWVDGSQCVMASPKLSSYDGLELFGKNSQVIKIESSAFVSLMIRRELIQEFGLPYKEFFIWADDLEYTSRINQACSSYVVLNSIVVHQTKQNIGTGMDTINSANFFKYKFGLRNELFYLRNISRLKAIVFCLRKCKGVLTADLAFKQKMTLLKALLSGWIFSPSIEYLK